MKYYLYAKKAVGSRMLLNTFKSEKKAKETVKYLQEDSKLQYEIRTTPYNIEDTFLLNNF